MLADYSLYFPLLPPSILAAESSAVWLLPEFSFGLSKQLGDHKMLQTVVAWRRHNYSAC